jgi:glycosyltransferase involved in cell wall biosynthesis
MGALMSSKLISVVLGSYNRIQFLPLTIESIRKELTEISHEIIVVDGGSTDGSLEWLVQQKDIITIIQHNRGEWNGKPIERRSWGYFMNLAFKSAQGKYSCMLSDDCLVVPGALKNGIRFFEQEQASGKKLGALAFWWRDWSQQELYHVGHTLGNKMYVNHGMYLTQALKDVDYIDEENFFFYNGDGDLCLKMWHAGYLITDSPDSYIEHYPHANVHVRSTNYQKYKQDLNNYLQKWSGIFYDKKLNNLGMQLDKKFDDPHKTGHQFQNIHEQVIASNPKLLQPKPWYAHAAQKTRWLTRAVVRKVLERF